MNLVTYVLGFAAQQPRDYLRLRRMRERVYTPVAELRAELARSPEPVPFAELDRTAFRPLRRGSLWGAVFECGWLRVTGEVPAGVADPVVLLGIGGEGLVYSPDGTVLDSVSTVFQQGDLPHSGAGYRPVRGVDTSTGRVEFYADVTYNGFLLYQIGRARYRGARLATRDDTAFGLYYDYLTLAVLCGSTPDAALASELRVALDAAWSRFRRHDLAGARTALAPALAARSDDDFVYSAIGHGHLDMAWLWPMRETRRKAARTYARALRETAQHEGYVYGTSQPQQLWWMKHSQPELFSRIKIAVAERRIELQGSFWVECDTNMPGGESLIRQALVGREFLQTEFGLGDDDLRLCWLPDSFGYSGNLPQILRGTGMDWFATIKLAWNTVTDFPHRTFTWHGIDGSRVLVHMPPEGDYNSRGAADGLLRGIRQYPERALDTALLVFGSGDGGGGPGEIHLELTGREQNLRGLPRVQYSSASDFFRRLQRLRPKHTHHGELYLETHQGTYTTQAAIKRGNRVAERKLHEAEALAAITRTPSREALAQHWRDVLLGQFHDILPGTGITRVAREARESLARIAGELDDYSATMIERLPRGGDEHAMLNLTGFPRDEHVKTDTGWVRAIAEPYASARLEPPLEAPLEVAGDRVSNGILTLRFGDSGEVASCVDADGTEHSAAGLSRLVLHRDPYVWPFNAWDIEPGYVERTPRTLRLRHVETVIDGPTIVRRQAYRSRRVSIDQRVILEAGSAVVRFDTTVEWHTRHRMLRAEFRPARLGDEALCEIQFGHMRRRMTEDTPAERAQFEVVAHKWIATANAAGGFAVLNDGKYGHRAKNDLISLNLLRAPTYPDKTADRGTHRFTYAFVPFEAGHQITAIREGYRLNNPLLPAPGVELPSVASTSHEGVVLETIKPAERGRGVVLRLYESRGHRCTTAVTTTIPHSSAHETDLLERVTGPADPGRLNFRPFEIKTILLEA
ncbi:MAG: alpha-mannosidase [Microbacteriaceae bacterium]|nr:alpha-mannosidase [Microbacteriaceae bacterium]